MPKMTILNEREIKNYDEPPYFQSQDRKQFLTLPTKLQEQLSSFHTTTNKVCFHLSFAYFKACGRFFTPARFRTRDIEFVCRRLGVFAFAVERSDYSRETFSRHKRLILAYFNYQPFDSSTHTPMLKKSVNAMIRSQFRPKLIFNFMVDLLRQKRIELPPYNSLQTIIVDAIGEYARSLMTNLERHLRPDHKAAMDILLQKLTDSQAFNHPYRITWLKYFNPKDTLKGIKANVEKLRSLQEIFRVIQPLIGALDLNPDAIRYYGELVKHYQIQQITRRSELSKYLYLLAFTAYQLYQLEDWLTDTLLLETRKIFNQAQHEHKQKQFEYQQLSKSTIRKVVNSYYEVLEREGKVIAILWSEDSSISDEVRIQLLRQLYPNQVQVSQEKQTVKKWHEQYETSEEDSYYSILESYSLTLQKQVVAIVKLLHFNGQTSDKNIIDAIQDFRIKDGAITKSVPTDFLPDKEKAIIFDDKGKFRISLFKILLFTSTCQAIRDGSLNLKYSYRYKAFDEYLIKDTIWKQDSGQLLEQADLSHLNSIDDLLRSLKKKIEEAYHSTNQSILLGENKFMRFRDNGKFSVTTPKVEEADAEILDDLFPNAKIIPLSEVLATVNYATRYLDDFIHFQPKYQKKRPENALFFAGITAYGCNLGIPTMTRVATPMSETELENTVNWYFDLANIDKANDAIVDFLAGMELPQLYKQYKDQLHTSSDGQKFNVKGSSIHSTYSYKYFGKGRGVTAYSYVDERFLQFYSTVINASEREATYVIDGLLHNEIVQSTIHSTDTHGYTEAVFALMNLLGFEFAPRIAKIYKQRLYSFTKRADYAKEGYKILPDGYINTELITENWDSILRLITSIKLKECSASQIFKRLNSYSRQHPVYQALKEYGKIIKTLFILKYIDDVELRRSIRRQLNKIEHSNRFSAAICFANNGELIFLTRQEQLVAESCKRLIKNAIICWNYLYLTHCIQKANTERRKKEIIETVKSGSAMAWKHIYFHGLYDFSDEKLVDSFNLTASRNYRLDLDSILG